MSLVRKLVGAVGLLATGATIAIAMRPELAAAIPLEQIIDELGGDWVFVAVFGALAALFLLVALAWRGVNGLDQTAPPTPEEIQSVPHFGSDFDDVVDGPAGVRDRVFSERSDRVRDRLRKAAITAEMDATGCSRAVAAQRVHDGSWTDDVNAAAFLSDDAGPSPPLSARLAAMARGRAWFQRGAKRAAEVTLRRTQEVETR